MDLARIIISERSDEQIIVLKERDGNRSFPILIGIFEAVAIDRKVKNYKTPRPMTHDLVENILKGLNASLDHIVVNDLVDKTFYARLVLKTDDKTIEIDSRPSDAVALAVQMNAPIFVEDSVLDEVAAEEQ
ncbi:MAG: bifunctional nuclease family protein [Planctomycetes bacterium]|nr:bifunctional nuclease family protein [Planctomycetota bacterium]